MAFAEIRHLRAKKNELMSILDTNEELLKENVVRGTTRRAFLKVAAIMAAALTAGRLVVSGKFSIRELLKQAEAATDQRRGKTMEIKFLQRSFFQRLLGKPVTPKAKNPNCWSYSDGKLSIDLKNAPELGKPGGAIRFEGGDLPVRVLVFFGKDAKYRAFRNRCTHMGHRRLDPVPGTNTVQCCSVNKSTYDYEGKKVYGPAPEPIMNYATTLDGDRLVVTIS